MPDESGEFEVAIPTRFAAGLTLHASTSVGQDATIVEIGAVEPGIRDLGDVALTSAPRIQVFVREPDGTPVDEAVAGVPYSVKSIAGPSGLDGALLVPMRDGDTKIVIGAIGFVPVERVLGPEERGPIEVRLARTPVLAIDVRGEPDNLPARLVVSIKAEDGKPAHAFDARLSNVLVAAGAVADDGGFDEDPSAAARFLVGPDGRATIAMLRPSAWFTVTLTDHLGVEHGSERLRMPLEQTRGLTLPIEQAVRRVSGRVTNPGGAGVPNANVRLSSTDHQGNPLVVDTDANGRFAIPGVAASRVNFLVSAERHAMRAIDGIDLVSNGDAALQLELQPATTVRLEIYLANGEPAAKALISMSLPMQGSGGRSLSRLGRKVEDGVYELRDVPHEPVEVRVRVNGEKHTFTIDGREIDGDPARPVRGLRGDRDWISAARASRRGRLPRGRSRRAASLPRLRRRAALSSLCASVSPRMCPRSG